MGCDIHCYAEKRTADGWDQLVGFESEYYDPDHEYFSQDRFKTSPHPLCGRNYTLFAAMANVRNGRGFAGCDIGDRVEPIAMPRGLPPDVCGEIKEEAEYWGGDGHSHSWLTAREIADHDEKAMVTHRGYVHLDEFRACLKEERTPNGWCGMVGGGGVVNIPNEGRTREELLEAAEAAAAADPGKSVYVQHQWGQLLREAAASLWEWALPALMKHSDGSGEDVRLVFWFDN